MIIKRVFTFAVLLCLGFHLCSGVVAQAAEEILYRHDGEIADPVFSPDGTSIVFSLNADGKRAIWLYDFGKKAAAQLISESGDLVSPSFSPDGRTVYYCAKIDGNYDLKAFSIASGSSRRITTTPDDEFRVECARSVFSDSDDNGKIYDKLFFLQGKNGSGKLCSMRADGLPTTSLQDYLKESAPADVTVGQIKNRIASQTDGTLILTLIPGAWTDLALRGDPDSLIVASPEGIGSAVYCIIDQQRPQVGIELPPGDVTLYKDTAGLQNISWAPDFMHLFAISPGGPVVRDFKTGAVQPFGPAGRLSRLAADPMNRRLAWVEKRDNATCLCIGLEPPDQLWYTGNMNHPAIDLASPAFDLIRSQGFVARPATYRQFFEIYEGNRYHWLDSYITADTVWFLFHLYYDYILKELESSSFRDRIIEISQAMAATAQQSSETATGEDRVHFEKIQGLFELAALLENDTLAAAEKAAEKLQPAIRDPLTADLKNIFAAEGVSESKLLGRSLDFSQFKLRGHYEKAPRLQSYFRIVMALSQFSLHLFAEDGKSPGTDLPTIAALAGVAATAKVDGKPVAEAVEAIFNPLSLLVGEAEDIGITDMHLLMEGLSIPPLSRVTTDAGFQKALFEKLASWPKPLLNPTTDTQVVFLPQRVTLDSEIMQRLVYRAVGTPDNQRLLPKLLDVMAALGSDRAEKLLREFHKESRFKNYDEHLTEVKKAVGDLPAEEWERSVYRGWLKSFAALLKNDGHAMPPHTKSEAWTDRLLTAALGSLTTLRHDTLLYNKMGGAEAGEGGEIEDWMIRRLPSVAVDPYPEVFGGLRRLTLKLYGSLAAQGYLPKNERDEESEESFDDILPLNSKGLTLKMIEILALLETCAGKQAAGQPLTDAEHEKLWRFGMWTEHLTIALIRPDKEFYNIVNEETSLIADVFNGSGTCLEVAIGRVFELWVRCTGPRGERLHRGGIFSYYEFEQPISNRLSDNDWRKMLREGKAPQLPGWTSSYLIGDPSKLDFNDGSFGNDEPETPVGSE